MAAPVTPGDAGGVAYGAYGQGGRLGPGAVGMADGRMPGAHMDHGAHVRPPPLPLHRCNTDLSLSLSPQNPALSGWLEQM